MRIALAPAWVVLLACASACVPATFHCTTSSQCKNGSTQGQCEANGQCSYPNANCTIGRQYGDGTCVPANLASDASVALPADGSIAVDQSVPRDESVSLPSDLAPPDTDMCMASQTDPNNCGACGNVCAAGEFCIHGVCSCPSSAPDFCTADMGSYCTNKHTDPENCGACGTVCTTGHFCQNGSCTPECTLTTCGAACVDTTSNASYCGNCSTQCALGQSCVNSHCACPSGTPDACGTGTSAVCTSKQTDVNNCGTCGNACPSGQSCVGGTCGGFLSCSGSVVDVNTNIYNCGACALYGGTVCDTIEGQTCTSGTCGLSGVNWPLPDTDQRTCYDDGSTGVITCPSAGQDYYGQDAQYGWDTTNLESARFTVATNIAEPTVTDNITELVWQGCTAGQTGSDCSGGGVNNYTFYQAADYCASLTWGGFADWRLPDTFELQSIVDYGTQYPAIDGTVFPNTRGFDSFWSSSSYSPYISNAWLVYFGDGNVSYDDKNDSYDVRCVRSGP